MKLVRNVCLLAAAMMSLAAVSAESSFEEEDDVIVLTDDTIDDALEQFDTLLVEFYAPWCGHCKALAPEYAKAAKELKKEGHALAKLDATENRKSAEEYGVKGFPTLKFFKNGKATEYTGDRTANGIVQWVLKRSGPPAASVESGEKAEEETQKNDVTVFGFFDKSDGKAAKTFEKIADGNDDVKFVVAESEEVRKAIDAPSGESVVVVKNFSTDKGNVVYDGELTDQEALAKFIDVNSLPLVIPFSNELSGRIFKGHVNRHFLLFVDRDAEGSEEILENYEKAAVDHKGEVLFITVSPAENRIMNFFEITEDDLPTAVLVEMPPDSQMKKYRYPASDSGEHDFSYNAINDFLTDFFKGNIKPFLKSDPIPAEGDDYEDNVKIVVGKNFEDVALDSSKDVLVEFYAPWCGHCKALAPEYAKAAERLADSKDVILGKMDATSNEVDYPGVEVTGFPTLYFFPADKEGEVVPYSGDRKAEAIVNFIKKHAKTEVNIAEEDDTKDEL
eukprot:gb/GECG01015775.1/.p1 GENE.gb/GECG01015775.1/~~gb/GECG01015775.1/.p1  ORF type:complete len:504 (+),score=111.12 gb/GECG01015775.1/:1-1512(+)